MYPDTEMTRPYTMLHKLKCAIIIHVEPNHHVGSLLHNSFSVVTQRSSPLTSGEERFVTTLKSAV